MALHSRNTFRRIELGVTEMRPFKAGNISGLTNANGWAMTEGRLPEEWRDRFTRARSGGGIEYAFYSYQTPIAWKLRGNRWLMPSVKYSLSTSDHQRHVFHAIESNGGSDV